ncbi:MAG: 4Fe-4S dicluster domain-containing protein [Labilithrix sp.]|nr:4Fe-4S dicluster domain-containing protein [Labilithrix sp.]
MTAKDHLAAPSPPDEDDPRSRRAADLAVALEDARDPIARRDFIARMGAAIALAGLGACTRAPRDEIIPYVVQPPEVTPGVPRFYATASTLEGYALGLLVESHEGRPTKVEGNPRHPASLGAAGAFEQASVLSLYDPTRARAVTERGSVVAWSRLEEALTEGTWTSAAGDGLHFLLEPTSSPAIAAVLADVRARLPRAVVSFHSPLMPQNQWEGALIAFGRVLEPRLALERADVVVALDADFLTTGPARLRLARAFADRRSTLDAMIRLYSVEALYTVTGAAADHRLRVRAGEVLAIAAALASAVGLPNLPAGVPAALAAPAEPHRAFIEAAARDLAAHRGRSVVIAGHAQPPEVHALAHAINAALDNLGATVTLAPSPIVAAGDMAHDTAMLASALDAGAVDTLVICGTNVTYASPADQAFTELLGRARQTAYLGLHEDETSARCTFMIPEAHALESWGDTRAFDGTTSIVQPLIDPLFGGRTALEVLSLFSGADRARGMIARKTPYDLVRAHFHDDLPPGATRDFEQRWRRALKLGIVEGTAIDPIEARVDWAGLAKRLARTAPAPPPAIELVIRPDPRVYDGRFASNAWLLELPAPVTNLTWTNAATLSTETADMLGIETGDELELRASGEIVNAPALVVPGQATDTIGLTLGWGRSRGATLAHGRGANAFALAAGTALSPISVDLHKTGRRHDLALTQRHHHLEGRDEDILHHATLEEHRRAGARHDAATTKRRLTLYDKSPRAGTHQWGMAIDLTRCTGCGACVVACQAENNVPTVGPDAVFLGRAMHWLRIDTYFVGAPEAPEIAPQPMLCQHCEMAPCEYVCPVNATVHSDDGLNEMVYNRCVGTRFCSNNCPYKVRRFNWFDFHRGEDATRELAHNPDVTVRQRGVMEKCTFCVQRLREHDIRERQGRATKPPETACQQTCPSRAIVFGDLSDAAAEVTRLRGDDRAYAVLDELATEPRVRYLARIKNPNPELP